MCGRRRGPRRGPGAVGVRRRPRVARAAAGMELRLRAARDRLAQALLLALDPRLARRGPPAPAVPQPPADDRQERAAAGPAAAPAVDRVLRGPRLRPRAAARAPPAARLRRVPGAPAGGAGAQAGHPAPARAGAARAVPAAASGLAARLRVDLPRRPR